MEGLKIIALSIGMSTLYGILHDLVTVQICLQYFTVFHPDIFNTDNPFLLALGWGVVATWWVGLILGLLIAASARAGDLTRISWRQLVKPLLIVMVASYAGAFLSGAVASLLFPVIPGGLVREGTRLGELSKYSDAVQHRIMIDLFAHNASYLVSAVGALILCGWIMARRIRLGVAPCNRDPQRAA